MTLSSGDGAAAVVAPVFATQVIEISGPAAWCAIASALCLVMAVAQPAVYPWLTARAERPAR